MAPSDLSLILRPVAHIYKVPGDRRCRRHRGAHQMGAAAFALASFEVAIRSAGASLARLEDVWVHREAHAASGLAPLEAGLGENAIEAETLRFRFYFLRAGHDHRVHAFCDVLALDDIGRHLEIGETRIGAGADKNAIDLNVLDARAGLERHVVERALDRS